MRTIVDGYNVIFNRGWLNETGHSMALEQSRDRLIRELADRIPATDRARVTIVFDAKTHPIKNVAAESLDRGFRILFAAEHDEADSLIEDLIRRHSNPKLLKIVSDDRRLKTAAKRRKAKWIGVEMWLEQLEKNPPCVIPDLPPVDKSSLEQLDHDWIAEFGLDDASQQNGPPTAAERDDSLDERDPFNPFPPGYGEDLLDDETT